MTWISDYKNQQKKVWWEWHYSFLPSHPHELDHFLPFSTIQCQGIELTKTLLFILKFLRCSNNLMQIMTSITPSIYKTIHQKVIFRQAYSRPGPFTAIPSICNQRSLTNHFAILCPWYTWHVLLFLLFPLRRPQEKSAVKLVNALTASWSRKDFATEL